MTYNGSLSVFEEENDEIQMRPSKYQTRHRSSAPTASLFLNVSCTVSEDLSDVDKKDTPLRASNPTLSCLSVPAPNRSRSVDGRVRINSNTRRRSTGRSPRFSDGLGIDSRRLCLSRDAVQPACGSLSDLRCKSLPVDNEELDVLTSLEIPLAAHRPRSLTCPDMKAARRKAKAKLINRPPTPPPKDFTPCLIDDTIRVEPFTGRRSRHASRDSELNCLDESLLPVITET